MNDFVSRFGGIARLYGQIQLSTLRSTRILIVGLGGVGAWTAEALARSGISHLQLMDLDEICMSNVNRQLHALDDTIGLPKVQVLAERLRRINPEGHFEPIEDFFTEASAPGVLALGPTDAIQESRRQSGPPDCVIDAIDSVGNKCLLLKLCRDANIPVVSCGGAGGRRDPTMVRIADLQNVTHDRLLREVRKRLRTNERQENSPKPMGVSCVYSKELPVFPQPDGTVAPRRDQSGINKSKEAGPNSNCNSGLGSATHVTGTFGFAAAARAIEMILRLPQAPSA